jgi:uncharacterized membrane protein SpoIIM required for sporulation
MLFFWMGTTIILGAFIGFTDFSEGEFFWGLGGEISQGVLSIACFTLVGAAFWRFGWKIGLADLLLVIIAGNVSLTLHGYFRRRQRFLNIVGIFYKRRNASTRSRNRAQLPR